MRNGELSRQASFRQRMRLNSIQSTSGVKADRSCCQYICNDRDSSPLHSCGLLLFSVECWWSFSLKNECFLQRADVRRIAHRKLGRVAAERFEKKYIRGKERQNRRGVRRRNALRLRLRAATDIRIFCPILCISLSNFLIVTPKLGKFGMRTRFSSAMDKFLWKVALNSSSNW